MKKVLLLAVLVCSASEKKRTWTEQEARDAYQLSVNHIARALKAPASARFAPFEDVNFSPGGATHRDDIVVRLWVDAQNSFGAYLRERYVCYVGPKRPDDTYRVACRQGL